MKGSSPVTYSGKLLREKTFANFVVLWLFEKVFSTKFGGMAFFGVAQVSNPRQFSLQNCIFHQFAKVSLLKISRYAVMLPALG